MSNLKDNVEALQENVHALIEAQTEYYKLWSFKVGMKSLTLLIHALLLTVFIALGVLFASVAVAFWLSQHLHSNSLGFLIVGSFYVLLSVLVYLLRKKIDAPILKKFSSIFFAD